MRKKITMLLASLFACVGVMQAQTATAYKVAGDATTTLADGKYVLVAKSSHGVGPCYYDASLSDRKFRYDLNTTVAVGSAVRSNYVWTIDETTVEGVQKITITSADDASVFFPKDAARNQNFSGTEIASYIPELKTIGGVDYFALTLGDTEVGYIHANQPGGNPNLSYWNGYEDGGTAVKFTFYPVTEDEESALVLAKQDLKAQIKSASSKLNNIKLQTADNTGAGYLSATVQGDAPIAKAIDNDPSTYYGSTWQSEVGSHHYWQVDLGDGVELSEFVFSYITRANGKDTPTQINVKGSANGEEFANIVTLTKESDGLPTAGGSSYTSEIISNSELYRYIRFEVVSTTSNYSMPGKPEQEVTIAIAEFAMKTVDGVVGEAIIAAIEVLNDAEASLEDVTSALHNLKVVEVTTEAALSYPITVTTDDANPVLYALKSGRGDAYWYTYDASDSKISLNQYTGANNQLWFFKQVVTEDYKVALQLYPFADATKAMSYQNTNNDPAKIVAQTPGTEGWTNLWLMVNTNGEAPYGLQTFDKKNYLSNNGGTGNKMGMWNAAPDADTGTAIYFSTPAEQLQSAIKKAEGMIAGEGTAVGYYTTSSINDLKSAIATAKEALTNKNYSLTDLNAAIAAVKVVLPEAGKFYQIVTGYKAFPETKAIYSTGEALAWKTLDAADKAFYWSITPNNEGTSFAFCNVADGKFANGLAMVDADAVTTTLKFLALGEFNIVSDGNTWHAAGHGSGAGQNGNIIDYGGGANGASSWMIVEVEHPDLVVAKATLQAKVDELKGKVAATGTNPGCYKAAETAKLATPIADAEAVLNGGSKDPATYSEALATLNASIATLDLEMIPLTAGYYFIKGTGEMNDNPTYVAPGSNKLWYATHFVKDGKNSMKAVELKEGEKLNANHVWKLEAIEGEDGYKLQQVNLGTYASLIAAGGTSTVEADYASGDKFTFEFDHGCAIIKNGNGHVMRTENDGRINYWGTESHETWHLIPVTELEISINDFASICLPFDVEVEGAQAYAVTGTTATAAILTAKADIPAGQGAILEGDGVATLKFTTAESDWTANMLKGSFVNTYVAGSAYVLATNGGETVGLYKAKLNRTEAGEKVEEGGTHFLNNANKAYLPAPVAEGAAPAMFVLSRGGEDEDATGIDQLINNGEVVIYDLAGRRVEKMEKGIYIVNGKKVVK